MTSAFQRIVCIRIQLKTDDINNWGQYLSKISLGGYLRDIYDAPAFSRASGIKELDQGALGMSDP